MDDASTGHDDPRGANANRVVVLGGGFGGATFAESFDRRRDHPEVETVVVDRHNYFLFYPLLVEAGIGSLEPRHVVAPIRSFVPNGRFRMAEAQDVDFERNLVVLRDPVTGRIDTLDYDHLVLALGSVTQLPDIPGLDRYGFRMKSLAEAVALRDRVIGLLEAANDEPDERKRRALLHFVVVGSNFTGVEVAGEYEAFLRRASRAYPYLGPGDFRVTLVEIADRILPALDEPLADYARRELERRGVEIRLEDSIDTIECSAAHLRSGASLETHTVIWCAGVAPNPLIEHLDLPTDDRGYVRCERDMRVEGRSNVWALGDTAVNRDARGAAYPPTAQSAVRQGRHLARNVIRAIDGEETTALDASQSGSIAALGARRGVARVLGIRISGFPAWWLYRTVYLSKMPGLRRKLRIVLDWTLDLFGSSDIVQLGVHRVSSSGAEASSESSSRERNHGMRPPASSTSRSSAVSSSSS